MSFLLIRQSQALESKTAAIIKYLCHHSPGRLSRNAYPFSSRFFSTKVKETIPLSLTQKIKNVFSRDYNRGPRDFDSSVEFQEKFNPDCHLSDDDGYQVPKTLLDEANKRAEKHLERAVKAEIQLNFSNTRLKAYEAAFGFRSLEEEKEELIVPGFLKGTNLNTFQKIVIALLLDMTDYARLVRVEIEKSNITVYEYARAATKFHKGISNKYAHGQGRPPTPKTKEEWETLFDLVGAFEEYEKKFVEIQFKPLPIPERFPRSNEFFVLIANGYKIQCKDINNVLNGLKGMVQSQVHSVKRDLHGTLSGYWALWLKCEELVSADDVHNSLAVMKTKKQPISIFVYSYSSGAAEDDAVDTTYF